MGKIMDQRDGAEFGQSIDVIGALERPRYAKGNGNSYIGKWEFGARNWRAKSAPAVTQSMTK